jgi:chemotaxis protein methyltransferase CheR
MDDWEYQYIKRQTLSLTGVDLNCYKAPQMKRRLKVYLTRSGYPNWPRFFRAIQANATALNQFKDYLTINVSAFFRDPEKYRYLQESVLPELLHSRTGLRIWSAGCSRGQEAYTLAMMLTETEEIEHRHQILATDMDSSALAYARAGGPYLADDLAYIAPALRQRYFSVEDDGYWVSKELRYKINFRLHNLLADPFTGGFDLIVCRNVVIYFEPAAKDELYRRFYNALRPGGVLFVGGTEIVSRAADIGFEMIGISFYRRPRPEMRQISR